MNGQYISTEIKGRKVIYYLTSENDIEAIKTGNTFTDIFLCFFSISTGGALTLLISLETNDNLNKELVSKYTIFLIMLFVIAIIFISLYFIFLYQSRKIISKIMASPKYDEFKSVVPPTDELKIIEAKWFSKSTKWDATKKLQNSILNNQLNTYASNDLIGDPEPGKDKWLTIKYSFEGKEFTKEYNQGEPVDLP